jgi:Protein of unknown function (DUF3301)
MTELIALICLLLVIFYFNDAASARDVARQRARHACESLGAQFLDQSVAFAGLGIKRNSHGQLRFARRYRFEFSRDRAQREPGWVRMVGHEVETLAVKAESGWQYL